MSTGVAGKTYCQVGHSWLLTLLPGCFNRVPFVSTGPAHTTNLLTDGAVLACSYTFVKHVDGISVVLGHMWI